MHKEAKVQYEGSKLDLRVPIILSLHLHSSIMTVYHLHPPPKKEKFDKIWVSETNTVIASK